MEYATHESMHHSPANLFVSIIKYKDRRNMEMSDLCRFLLVVALYYMQNAIASCSILSCYSCPQLKMILLMYLRQWGA